MSIVLGGSEGFIIYIMQFSVYKIARPQESQSFTAYTFSKEQYDSWEWFFMKLWYNQADHHARIWLASLARVYRFALTKIFEKKKVCLNRLEMLWNA